MVKVRNAGISAPATSVYAPAATTDASAPTRRDASRSVSRTLRRASAEANAPASAASAVTCSPEMLTRCPTPVRLNTVHCASGTERWSPIDCAATTPA